MSYYFVLIFTFIVTLLWSYYFWKMIRRKGKRKFAFHIVFFRYVIPALLLFIFGITFISYAIDLPAVSAKEPTRYEGNCEIVMEELHEDVFTVEAVFEDTWAEYEHEEFPKIKEGEYYCKVDYYPGSSIGTELQLYFEQDGAVISIK